MCFSSHLPPRQISSIARRSLPQKRLNASLLLRIWLDMRECEHYEATPRLWRRVSNAAFIIWLTRLLSYLIIKGMEANSPVWLAIYLPLTRTSVISPSQLSGRSSHLYKQVCLQVWRKVWKVSMTLYPVSIHLSLPYINPIPQWNSHHAVIQSGRMIALARFLFDYTRL